MEQDIFQVFFDVLEVIGVGIIDGQTQLDFYVKGQVLNVNEQQKLTKNILEVIASKHDEVIFFECQVMDFYAYIYKLNHNVHILILTHVLITKQLKSMLQKDIEGAITKFKISIQNISRFSLEIKVTTEELVNALNDLSKFSSKYIGPKLTANYLELTRPQFEWINNFQINYSAKITFSEIVTDPVSALQHQWVKQWTAAFIKRCAQTLKDFPVLIEQKGLDESQKKILLSHSASSLTKPADGPRTNASKFAKEYT